MSTPVFQAWSSGEHDKLKPTGEQALLLVRDVNDVREHFICAMLIRLIPPSPHPAVLYALTFPSILPLQSLGPGATIPAAWSSQLQIITSFLQLDPPSSIHMLDRAVGLVARTHEVSMNIPHKEIVVQFVDGQVASVPMNSDCVRMLLDVVLDVKGCSEPESQQDSVESSGRHGSTAGSVEDIPSRSSPTKCPRLGKHKRQRSLLFSLISSLVPKSLSLSTSSSSPSPPPTAPPPTPLPPLPAAGRVTSPAFPRQARLSSESDPDMLRRRARATLVDVWRRHIVSALPSLHLPAAGYAEWTLTAMASQIQVEIESMKTAKFLSHDLGVRSKRSGGKHRRTQSEGRNALDYGDRRYDHKSERCRAPSPFPGMSDAEDVDQVVYPRWGQANEWGVRYVDHPKPFDEVDIFAVELNSHNDSLLTEDFMAGSVWDDHERLTFEFDRSGRPGMGISIRSSGSGGRHLHPTELDVDSSCDDSGLADTAFDMSRTPLVPSDVDDNEESDDLSFQTSEEELPFARSANILQGSTHLAAHGPSRPPSVSRVTSSRPRSRNAPGQILGASSTLARSPSLSIHPPDAYDLDSRDVCIEEIIFPRCELLDRLCSALEIVRGRAREEGWRLVRAGVIGAKDEWTDSEAERALEIKAKRRAWSSGIKIYAPYSSSAHSTPKAWTGSFSTFRSPMSPPGLRSPPAGILRVRGPIVPTGLSLGIPLRSSPLAAYVWGADNKQPSTPRKHGNLNSVYGMETIEGRRSSRVTFTDSVTKLFPVCEDDNEDSSEPVLRVSAIGFPQTVPLAVSTDELDVTEAPADDRDDPFCFYPPRPRTRTQSIRVVAPTPSLPSSSVLPVVRPSTPPPSYQVAVGESVSVVRDDEEGGLGASALLPLSISPSSQPSPPRPPLTSNPPFVPRPRAVSLPVTRPFSGANKTRRTSFGHKEGHYEDLTRTYASPPPEGPLEISATPAPHEQFPRYAHVQSPVASKKGINGPILGKKGKEVVFEQAGSEFTVGLEIALGRAEEGRVVW